MKRLLLANFLSVLVVPLGLATTNYVNNGVVSVVSPPQIVPSIDASNFVNNGTFNITNQNINGDSQIAPPFESSNTRNWTNSNRMMGDSGFRFDYFSTAGQTNGWSANFQNAGNINETNSTIFGSAYLLISATNVVNKGTLAISGPGLMTLTGSQLDLTRGTMVATGNDTNAESYTLDDYWAVGGLNFYSNVFDEIFVPNNLYSPTQAVQTIAYLPTPPHYRTFPQSLNLTNSTPQQPIGYTAYVLILPDDDNPFLTHTEVLFLSQTNASISTDVRFWPGYAFTGGGFPNGPYWFQNTKVIQFQSVVTNRATGVRSTNYLYFSDTNNIYVNGNQVADPPALVPTVRSYLSPFIAQTFRPANYGLDHVYPTFGTGMEMTATNLDFFDTFAIWNLLVEDWGSSYGVDVVPSPFSFDESITGSTFTNMPGRIQITATKALTLERAVINQESYLSLVATNHFIGSTNAAIVAPYSDIALASTNGTMRIANLVAPTVPRMCGEIKAWSGKWLTHLTPPSPIPATSNYFYVTFVEADLGQQLASQILNLYLRSTNLFISDALNVSNSLLLDVSRLTITTNGPTAPTPNGELNLTSGNLLWSPSLPILQYLTNYGKISSANSIYFGGARTPPWYTGTFTEPYVAFVNHGYLQSQGNSTWATYYEFGGTNDSGIGPLTVQATSAILTNGTFLTPQEDILITANNLLISNQTLVAGRSVTLTVTNTLDDGSLTNSVSTNNNFNMWTVSGGINLLLLPTNGSLLATVVSNTAFSNSEVDDYWAGKDYGSYPRGFVSNSALGHLILNGTDAGSLFTFLCVGQTNALYVDLLELAVTTTNADDQGDFAGVYIQTNFTVYYGDAIAAGHSIAEKLNGKFGVSGSSGGRFIWVSNYNTGFFSSTNVTYTDGSVHQLNRALVYSCDINSNGQPYPPTGGANATCDGSVLKPSPVPVLTPQTLILTAKYTNGPPKAILLSWNTIPFSCNYLFAATSPLATGTNWQLVTNFISSGAVSGEVTVQDTIKTNGTRYYRVNALSP